MRRKPVDTRIWASGGKIYVKHIYADSPEYQRHVIGLLVLFLVIFTLSGYYLFQQPFDDRPEYLVSAFTLFVATWTSRDGKRPVIFIPAFILGCIWGGASLLNSSISFDLAAYVFSYCVAIMIMMLIDFLKRK